MAADNVWPSRWARKTSIYAVLLTTAALVAGMVVARGQAGFFVHEDGPTLVQDFASHLVVSRGIWSGDVSGGETGSAYSVPAHLRLMAGWMGEGATRALPFGYSPTMLWLLLPLSFLPIPLAYLLWTLSGATMAGWMISRDRFHWLLGLMVFLTPIMVGAIALGQTAVLGTVGVFYLANRTLGSPDPSGHGSARAALVLVLVLWALSAKPPLAVTAGAAMLALGIYRPVLLAAALAGFGALVLTPRLGSGWVLDYLHLMSHYDRVGADPAFAWSLWPEHMSNLRALLSVDLGVADDTASFLSNLSWLASLALVVVAGWLKWFRPPMVWAMAILSYLLFCPHVSSTEVLILLLVPALVLPWGNHARGWLGYLPWMAVPLGLLLSPALGPASGVRPSLLLLFELGLGIWLLVEALRDYRQSSRESSGPLQMAG